MPIIGGELTGPAESRAAEARRRAGMRMVAGGGGGLVGVTGEMGRIILFPLSRSLSPVPIRCGTDGENEERERGREKDAEAMR